MLRTVLTRRFLFLLVSIFGLNSMGCSQTRMPNSGPSVEPFEPDDRLEVPAIHEILRVAEPNDIPILLHGQGLVEIISDQTNADEYAYAPFGMEGGEQTPELLHHSDGSPYVKIVPVRLGKLTIRLTASFVDGGFALQSVTVEVGPSKVLPAALGLCCQLVVPNGMYVVMGEASPQYIQPAAYYSGMRVPIILPPRFVTFEVKTPKGRPIVEVDASTGKIIPLRVGDAMLETRFAGTTMHTCIQVRSAPYTGEAADRANCKGLRHLDEVAANTPLNRTWSADPGGSVSFFGVDTNFFVDRLSVVAPDGPKLLGQPIRIPVRLSADKIRSVVFQQWIYNNGSDVTVPSTATDANGVPLAGNNLMPIGMERPNPLRDGGETGKFIEIVPAALGNVEVGIGVYFEDGGFSERFFRMKVVPAGP